MKRRHIFYLLLTISFMATLAGCSKIDETVPPSIVGTWYFQTERQIETSGQIVSVDTTYILNGTNSITFTQDMHFTTNSTGTIVSGSYNTSGSDLIMHYNNGNFDNQLTVTTLTSRSLQYEHTSTGFSQSGTVTIRDIISLSR